MLFPKKVDGPLCPKCRDNYLRYHGNNRECLKCGHKWNVLAGLIRPPPTAAARVLDLATRSFNDE